MTLTRPRDLVVTAVVAGVLVHLLVRLGYGSLPPLPTLAGITLLVLAMIELLLGFNLRARIRRREGSTPVQPLTAARAVALAKASSLVGAIMVGAWAGVLGYVLPRRTDLVAAANDTPSAVVGLVCSAALVGAALWLEYCCRTPKDPREQDQDTRQ